MKYTTNNKKYDKILAQQEEKIKKMKQTFFQIRDELSKGRSQILEKKFNCIIKIEKIFENDRNIECVRILGKEKQVLLYEIKYGIDGVSIRIGDNQFISGIYFAKFLDFNCDKLQNLTFNDYGLDRIYHYEVKVNEDNTANVNLTTTDRPDKSTLGKIVAKFRK